MPVCRAGLAEADLEFLRSIFTPDSPGGLERFLEEPDLLQELLDHPRVLEVLLESTEHLPVSQRLYFYVMLRSVLKKHGFTGRELADYVASLLDGFSRSSRSFEAAEPGKRSAPFYVLDMLQQIADARQPDQLVLMVDLANRSLFFTGLYPEHLEERARRTGAPALDYYENIGRAQYKAASGHPLAQEFDLAGIYEELSDQFSRARQALNDFSAHYAFGGRN